MKDVKDIPNSVLRAFQPFLETKSDLFVLNNIAEAYLNFEGLGKVSDCFFKVTDYKNEGGKFLVSISQKPKDQNSVDIKAYFSGIDDIKIHLTRWTTLLEERKHLQEIFSQNSRISDIENEFFESTSYFDGSFDFEYFSIEEANRISLYCEKLIEYVDRESTISNKSKLIEEIESLEKNCAQESKRMVARRISKIQSLLIKNGPKILKEALSFTKDVSVNIIGSVVSKMITG